MEWCYRNPQQSDALQPRFDVAVVEMEGYTIYSMDYLENAFGITDSTYIF
ncbi:MAG: hypothetical protein LUF89_07430 [Ruminococcus sp.]|nr:hypothetical protein [Ruminococcus sp.]